MKTVSKPCHVRWLIRADVQAIMVFEGDLESPWSEDDLVKFLRQRNAIAMVAERDSKVLGYMAYELYATKIDLKRFVVDPLHSRSGVGTNLIAKLKSKLSRDRRRLIEAVVPEELFDLHVFMHNHGFIASEVTEMDDGRIGYRFVFRHEWDQS